MKSQHVTGGGGTRVHVVETGNPEGRPILFLHGFSQCWLAWSRQMNSDLAEDHRLVAIDLRGHGLSERSLAMAYFESRLWADDVHAVLGVVEASNSRSSPAGGMARSSSSTTFGTTGRMPSVASTSSVGSRSSGVMRRYRFSTPEFLQPCSWPLLSTDVRRERGQSRSIAANVPHPGTVSDRSVPDAGIQRPPSRRMYDRRCSHARSTTTISCRKSVSPC